MMDDAVKRYRDRRAERLRSRQKEREDDQWITMKGTHVMVDDGGQVSRGPDKLKAVVKNSGGYKSREQRTLGAQVEEKKATTAETKKPEARSSAPYESLPVVFRLGGSQYASPEEKKQRRETLNRFMKEAKEGDVYSVGGGVGSAGGSQFEVVHYNRSPNKLGLKWKNGRGQAVAMSRENVEKFISNGATLV